MRKIEPTGQFRRDYKREAKGQHRATLDADLEPVLEALASDQPLEPRHRTMRLRASGRIIGILGFEAQWNGKPD